MKLQTKLLLILSSVFLLAFLSTVVADYYAIRIEVMENLKREASSIRGVLMATRRVYHHQFLESGIPLNNKTLGFLPAHSLNRISADFNVS